MKYSLSARILETNELLENIRNCIQPNFEEFANLVHNCNFDGVNLRFWQINPATVSGSEITRMKEILNRKKLKTFVIQGKISKKFIERAKFLEAETIQTLPQNIDLIPDRMKTAIQMHTGGDFETIADCVKSFASKYHNPELGIFPEPGNLQLVGEKFTEDMFLPLKDRIFGYFFQSLEVGSGNMHLSLKNGGKVKAQRVEAWKNKQLDMVLFAKAVKKCDTGKFININEPPPINFNTEIFLQKTLAFIREKF